MESGMTHEERRELQVLSDAEALPKLGKYYYNFKSEPELAATARRLGRKPVPHMIEISESANQIYLIRMHESGKVRLSELRTKLAAEQHS
jgi:hypothetical protein